MKTKILIGLMMMCLLTTACTPSTPSSEASSEPSSSTPSSSSQPTPSSEEPRNPPPEVEGDYVSIHYQRPDDNYSRWALWLWEKGYDGSEYEFNGFDDYGAVAKYALSSWSSSVTGNSLGFIVKSLGSWDKKDVEADRFIDFTKITKTDDGGYHIYLLSGDENIYVNPQRETVDEISVCEFVSFNRIVVSCTNPVDTLKIYENDTLLVDEELNGEIVDEYLYKFEEGEKADLTNSYSVEVKFTKSQKTYTKSVSFKNLYNTSEFNNTYFYDGDDLGATYTKNETTFKVWSPVSNEIKLRIYSNGTPTFVDQELGSDLLYLEQDMVKGSNGVFSATIEEDLEGKYYTYVVTNGSNDAKEIVDPYAKSAGVNGLRGMIVDFSKTNPEGWDNITAHQYDRKSLTVYETHISDISSSTTWSNNPDHASSSKKFKGAYLSGTTYTEGTTTVTTGFDHIKELGVNAVQFVPIFDQANDEINLQFNWGYNPLNYNVLEGGYSSNPHDGYVRIKEFKELVKAYNQAGINIIMDVVYNHVNGANGSNFDVLMPEYYYRYNADGVLSNGSGCGNETASEMPMFRKFMIDSAKFWAEEYKLGGFRYDLMALHDIETMNEVVAQLKEINPSICVYGEPWNGGATPLDSTLAASQANANQYVGFGQFNDQMRDALIAGGMKGANTLAWITNETLANLAETPKIKSGISGTTDTGLVKIADPDKTVNYVTCHDNYTLVDRFAAAGIVDEAKAKSMALLSNSIVFTSQGTSFMLAGEEFLRTKGGDHNSYQSSYKVNELDYSLKIKHSDMVDAYQKLIAFKQNVDGMHLDKAGCAELYASINFNAPIGSTYEYTITDSLTGETYKVIHRNGVNSSDEITFDLTGYELYLSTADNNKTLTAETVINPFETIIAVSR